MVAYADTSFLFSLYGHDANSVLAQQTGSALKVPLAITRGARNFLTFDTRQRSLAVKAGLKVRLRA